MNTSFSRWQRLAFRLIHRTPAETTQGLTLIECIMAIVVIALTTAMITPPLFLAAATRLQNQRAEQALQIAQGEVDRIRALVELGRHQSALLPAVTPRSTQIRNTDAPTSLASIQSSNTTCANRRDETRQLPLRTAYGVDTTGDCQPDFAVQTFRSRGQAVLGEPANGRPGTFCLVVRVYGKPAINDAGNGFVNALQTDQASIRFTSGQGNQSTRPLAVITTPMIWSDLGSSVDTIQDSGRNICG